MGTRVLWALIPTVLIAGLFYVPSSASWVHADEMASSTPEVATTTEEIVSLPEPEIVSTEEAEPESEPAPEEPVATTTPDTTSLTPLPTGVLFDNSYADEEWDINVFTGGHYVYLFKGYESLGNPVVLSTSTSWVTTGTTTSARIKKTGDTACSTIARGATGGLAFYGPHAESYSTIYIPHTIPDDSFCDFVFWGEGIPPGTAISMAVIGRYGTSTIAGSHANPGTSLNGSSEDPVAGGFAFQLCGVDGCSGGFASSTPPTPPAPESPQISNVLFLPGIKGSRLYSDESRCGLVGCDNKLWDPLSSTDVQDLYLTPEGKSSRSDIYTKNSDIIDTIPGKRIYASFIEDMDAMQASTTFNGGNFKWRATAYDWRLSLDDIINNGTQRGDRIYYGEASSTPYIEQTLRELAHTSTTGKVTIIAHSNGGLVTKALLQKLGDAETASLVDKIIFVGVPQTGAPQALGGLLFGDREGLPLDLLPAIATPAVARGLAEYSPMAYHLMPSSRYLTDVQDSNHSIIGFSGSVLYGSERSAYGPSIDTITELDNFLLAQDGGREKPEATDAASANVLNSGLITYANTVHSALDSWVPPASVTLYQIAGWGANTISGIDFYDEKKVLGVNTGYKKQYRPIFVEDGDGVVPVPSALMTEASANIHNYWLNLNSARKNHGTLFESPDLRDFISSILSISSETFSNFITQTQPQSETSGSKLIFQLHSPLTLGLYDSSGKYTGLNEDGTVSEEVSGAEYGEFGDVKYLIAPAGVSYELVMHGQEDGTFSLDIQEQNGDSVTTTTIADVPTTSKTVAKLNITSGIVDASSLSVDTNGDNTADIVLAPVSGQTVQYEAPVTVNSTEDSSTSSKSSGTIFTASPAIIAPAMFIPNIPITPLLKPRVLGAGTSTLPITTKEGQTAGHHSMPQSQTASVYNAFAPLTEWLKTLMYNTWQGLISLIRTFFIIS